MSLNKINIALLLGDPSGIGPELVSKLLSEDITNKANIIIIGERKILENGNEISGNKHNINYVDEFDKIDFKKSNKFFLDITQAKIMIISCQNVQKNQVKVFCRLLILL